MIKATEATDSTPAIDRRILSAVERNLQYLELTEWLEAYRATRERKAEKAAH
jgi:hypothetical protein